MNPFKNALQNVFFNARGEYCTNGATSRSKVMVERRKAQSKDELVSELKALLLSLKKGGRTERLVSRINSLQNQIKAL